MRVIKRKGRLRKQIGLGFYTRHMMDVAHYDPAKDDWREFKEWKRKQQGSQQQQNLMTWEEERGD